MAAILYVKEFKEPPKGGFSIAHSKPSGVCRLRGREDKCKLRIEAKNEGWICWVEYAVDKKGNWNRSMKPHCFKVKSEELVFKCKSVEDCGGVQYSHIIKTGKIEGMKKIKMQVIPKGSCYKIEVYLRQNEKYHQVLEKPVTNPEKPTELTFITTIPFDEIQIYMPESEEDSKSEIRITETEGEEGVLTILGTESCNNGIGYSLGYEPFSGHPKYCHTGLPDCCSWYQYTHVHDFNETIQPPTAIYVEYRTGWSNGCQDTVKVYASNDNQTWHLLATQDTTSQDADGVPGYPEDWTGKTIAIGNCTQAFRWIKVAVSNPYEGSSCYVDYSYVVVTNAVGNEIPVAHFTAPDNATVGEVIVFNATSSYDIDGNITQYKWEFGDYNTTVTTNPVITHTYDKALSHIVNLIVTDDDGAMNWYSKEITIVEKEDTTPPWSNHPSDVNVTQGGEAEIEWVLYDNIGEGYYRVLKDGEVYVPWTQWVNGSSLDIQVDTSVVGTYNYTIYYNDSSGNEGTPDSVMINVIENNPPSTPELIEPENESEITNTTPFFDWTDSTDPENDTVSYELLVDNDSDFSSPEINESTPESEYTSSEELELDTYYWKVRAWDGTSYSDWSETWVFTIVVNDTTPPWYSNDGDNSSGSIVQGVVVETHVLWDDNTELEYGVFKTNVTGVWENTSYAFNSTPSWLNVSINTSNASGLVCWSQSANDSSGNVNNSMPMHCFEVMSDVTPPTVQLNYPVNGELLNESNVTFIYTPTDDTGFYGCYLYTNESGWSIKTGNTTNILNASLNEIEISLSDGSYLWNIYCNDTFGNGAFAPMNWTVSVDTTPPDAYIYSPENGTVINHDSVMVYYNSSFEDVNHSQYKVDDGEWQVDPNGSPTGFTGLSDGVHVLYVRNVDHAGNIGLGDNVTVIVDTHRPDTEITYPENYTEFEQNWVEVKFKTPDEDVEGFEFSYDNISWYDTGITDVMPDVNYTHNFTNLPFGISYLYVRAYDEGGAGKEDFVIVNITVSENLAPDVTITYPEDNGIYPIVEELRFIATDDNATDMLCNYTVDNGEWNQTIAENNTETVVPISVTEAGWHEVLVTCFDGELWTLMTPENDFYIDLIGPETTIIEPENNSLVNTPTITYEAVDEGIGVDYYEVRIDFGSWIPTNNTTYTFEDVEDGQHWFHARAVDKFGNIGQETMINATLDTVKPDVWIDLPINGSEYIGSWVTVDYICDDEDLDHTEVKVDDGEWVVDPDGPSNGYTFYNLSDGIRYLWVKAVDYAGNVDTDYVWVIINANGPNVTITSPENGSYYYVDDVNVSFYSNDTDIDTFQYSFNGADWSDTGIEAEPDVVYTYTVENVPEGNSTIYIRGRDTGNNYGQPEAVNVYINSTFTYLDVWTVIGELIQDTWSWGIVDVVNNNEEAIPAGDVEVNLTTNTTNCFVEGPNPQPLWEIPPYGSDHGSWHVMCYDPGNATFIGTMIYKDGRTKVSVEIVPVYASLGREDSRRMGYKPRVVRGGPA